MNSSELDEIFEFVKDLVIKSGEALKEGFLNTGIVRTKTARHDLVTVWDEKVEDILINGIKKKYPTHKFIGEEDSAKSGESELTSDPTWIIDSIDGTINFVKKIHLVCISVALTVDRDLKIGYLYNPVLNEFFSAKKGHGAFLNGERIEASKNQEFEDSVMAHEFSLGYIKPYLPKYIERGKEFIKHCIGVRSFGSAALTLGYIAKGAIDAYSIEDLKCWDIAAGALIVQEAGGVILNKDGGEYNIMRPDIIAAGNLTLANKVKEIIQKVDEELEQKGMLPHQLIFK